MNDLEARVVQNVTETLVELTDRLEKISDALEAELRPPPRPSLTVVDGNEWSDDA